MIGKSAFELCTSLEVMKFETVLTKLSQLSFANCTSLKKIIFSTYLLCQVAENCFSGYDMLSEIVFETKYIPDLSNLTVANQIKRIAFNSKNIKSLSNLQSFPQLEAITH